MAVCPYCEREMTTGVSCTAPDYADFLDGRPRARVRHPEDSPGPCHDCRTPAGGLHHPGCDAEVCPGCSGQAIACSCLSG